MFKNKFNLKILMKVAIMLVAIITSAFTIKLLSKQIDKVNLSMGEKKVMNYLISNREEVNNRIKVDFLKVDPDYQAKINASLPSVYNILPFVDALESLSKKYSFKQTLSFSQPAPATDISGPTPVMKTNFNLTIENINIDIFVNYLKDFESLPYFASIDGISYLGTGDAGWKNSSTINISGSFYAHQ